jgi:hypothetical protein
VSGWVSAGVFCDAFEKAFFALQGVGGFLGQLPGLSQSFCKRGYAVLIAVPIPAKTQHTARRFPNSG